ncbi:MAG: HD-GYP domain-containing protein [Saccharospirillum sp.]
MTQTIQAINDTTVKMPAALLQVGMFVCRLDRPWLGTPFLMQGLLIEDRQILNQVRDLCDHVYVDPKRSQVNITLKGARKSYRDTPEPSFPASVDRDMARIGLRAALPAYSNTLKTVKSTFKALSRGELPCPHSMSAQIDRCIDALTDNIPAMTWLSRIHNHDDYSYEHAMNVSLLAMVFGIHCGWPREEVRRAGLAGLLFDLGKLRLPRSVLTKPEPLSEPEWRQVREHPKWTRYLLEKSGFETDIVQACYFHHEQPDGRGYPVGKVGGQVPLLARLIRILDSYDAMTTDRPYAQALTVYDAIRQLYRGRAQLYDATLVEQFIELMGVYPIGTLIELSNGEVGVVIGQNHDARLLPKVAIVRNPKKEPCPERAVNLKHLASHTPIRVTRMLGDGSYGVFMRQYTRELMLHA